MRVALAQINSTVGDFQKNRTKIVEGIERAIERRCDLVVFPELALFGYSPNDLLEQKYLVNRQLQEISKISRSLKPGMAAIFGAVVPSKQVCSAPSALTNKPFMNCAVWLEKGKKPRFFAKQYLPEYDVFDEGRHFQSGWLEQNTVLFKKRKILVGVCEDLWSASEVFNDTSYRSSLLSKKNSKKLDLIVGINASPFALGKAELRLKLAKTLGKTTGAELVYVNMVGAQDEIIYDGGSFVTTASGKLVGQCLFFEEDLNVFDLVKREAGFRPQALSSDVPEMERLRQALVLGIRDFVEKQGFQKVHLGLSGGVDSALVAALAVDALGPRRVTCIAMPGPFSAPESLDLAKKLADNLNCDFLKLEINKSFEVIRNQLDRELAIKEFQLAHENLQARLRGLYLMAFSNLNRSLLLTTGNKSEYATGYATLYGDMCGGLAPIADLLKLQVWELCRHYNKNGEIIPKEIIEREPSAELRPNQKDQDSLPPYKELDQMVQKLVVDRAPPSTPSEKWLAGALFKSEFKRWQAPPILRVSSHAFGRGRRMPIVNRS